MNPITTTRCRGFLTGIGGLRLHYRTWEAADPAAAVLVIHGLSDHAGRYADVADVLIGEGFSAFALDLRGHGASEGRRGHVRNFACLLQDVDRFLREVTALTGRDTPLFFFGHSLGGLIVLRYLAAFRPAIRGAVVSSPWIDTARLSGWQRTAVHALSRVLPALPLRSGIRAEDLSHNTEAVRAYNRDPRVHNTITPRLYTEAERAGARVLRHKQFRVPLLFMLAGADRVVDTAASVRLAKGMDTATTTVKVYPGRFHEIWNETDSQAVIADLVAWMRERLEWDPAESGRQKDWE